MPFVVCQTPSGGTSQDGVHLEHAGEIPHLKLDPFPSPGKVSVHPTQKPALRIEVPLLELCSTLKG